MRKILFLLAIIFLLTTGVDGLETESSRWEAFHMEQVEDALPKAAEPFLDEIAPGEFDFIEEASEILSDAALQGRGFLKRSLSLVLQLLLIVVFCRLAETGGYAPTGRVTTLAGVLALTVFCASDLRSMIGLGKNTIEEMMEFSTCLMPVMAAAAAASGSFTGAGILYGTVVTFSKILIGLCGKILIPLIYAYLAMGVTDGALKEARLSSLREFLGWLVRWGLKIMMYLFTGILTVSGILSGSVDSTALKTAKVTLSGMVPIVGGIISDAAESVLYSAGIVKGAVGTFGMLAFLAVFSAPFLKMGLQYMALKLTAALSGVIGSSLSGFLECIAAVMGLLLAMLGSCILMCLLSCCCFMLVNGL